MRISLNKTKLIIILFYLIAYFFLLYAYSEFIVSVFGYEKYEWSPDMLKVLESLLAILFFAWFLPSTIKRPSDFFIHIHFLLPIIPMLVLYGASDRPREYMYFVILAFLVVCSVRKLELPKIEKDIVSTSAMIWGLLTIAVIYILSIIIQGGFSYFNLDLLRVYEFRSAAAENLPGIAGYLSPMISNIVLPFLLILSVSQRKWFITALSITGSLMMFAFTSHKGPLFYPFLALAIYYVMQSKRRLIAMLLTGYILLIVVSLFPFFISKIESTEPSLSEIVAGSLVIRRGYFVPAQLNFAYYDFFSINPHTVWAESKLTFGLVDYPYDIDAPHLIGFYMFKDDTAANTGWLGSGYMQYGFAGLLLYAFVIGLLLATVDMLAIGRELGIFVAILFTPFLSLFISSDLPTVMLTHGLLFALFLAWACTLKKRMPTHVRNPSNDQIVCGLKLTKLS